MILNLDLVLTLNLNLILILTLILLLILLMMQELAAGADAVGKEQSCLIRSGQSTKANRKNFFGQSRV